MIEPEDVTDVDQKMQFLDELQIMQIHASQVHRRVSDLKNHDMPDLEEEAAAAIGADELADAIYDLEHACNDGDTLADTQLEEWREEIAAWSIAHVG